MANASLHLSMAESIKTRRARQARRRQTRRRRVIAGSVVVAASAAVLVPMLSTGSGAGAPTTVPHPVRPPIVGPARLSRLPAPIPGYLLIADRGNNRLLLVDSAKHVLWRYPGAQGAPLPFRFDDDAFFGPGLRKIISNQEDQHTIQVISFPGGKLLWRYGHTDVRGSDPGSLNTPDDAYLLPHGVVSVADAYNCRVLFISPGHHVVRRIGSGACVHNPPHSLGLINGATPAPGGRTLVSEIGGSWIDSFAHNGRLLWAFRAPVSYPSDPQPLGRGRIMLADYARPGHALILDPHGGVLWSYGPPSGPGMLDHPSLALPIGHGLVAINDDYRDRVVLVSIARHRIVWQYGRTDVPGDGPGLLRTPDGMDLLPFGAALRIPAIRRIVLRRRLPAHAGAPGALGVSVTPLPLQLPRALERAVAVVWRGRIVIAGGLDGASASAAGVFALDPATGRLRALGTLPQAFHDAAGGLIRSKLFIFGGGATTSSSAVQVFDLRTGRGTIAGRLPHPLSDASAARIGGSVYIVGGFDGTHARREIIRTDDGLHFSIAARLPLGLRYPALAVAGGYLIIAGGQTEGGLSARVYSYEPASGRLTPLSALPQAVAHAAAVTIGHTVYVIGGRTADGKATATVTAVDWRTGASRSAHIADAAVADTAVARDGPTTYLVGGWNGAPVANVLAVGQR